MERSRWKEIGLEEWRDGMTYIYTPYGKRKMKKERKTGRMKEKEDKRE